MNTKAQVNTLGYFKSNAENAEARLANLSNEATFGEREEAKQALRKAREALRVFIYRSKPSLSASGHALRH